MLVKAPTKNVVYTETRLDTCRLEVSPVSDFLDIEDDDWYSTFYLLVENQVTKVT